MLALGSLLFVGMIVEAAYWRDGYIEIGQLRIVSFLFSLCVCLMLVKMNFSVGHWNVLAVLGRGSFFIYFTHMKFFILFFELKKYGFWFCRMSLLAYVTDIAVIALFYYAMIYVLERTLPAEISKNLGVSR